MYHKLLISAAIGAALIAGFAAWVQMRHGAKPPQHSPVGLR